ncbi:MAG: hypothetical protein IJN02_06175 [Bacteroidales bacterium]|nr:hypothetical protein [Bacteroidales bacterium]
MSRYEYLELACFKNSGQPDISLSNNKSYKLSLFRMLSGTINLRDTFTGRTYRQRCNYFTLPYSVHTTDKSLKVLIDLFEEDVTLSDLNNYFRNNHKNKDFYRKLEGEVARCMVSKSNGQYIDAFLHLYRSIECMSYSFPLLYASRSKEYLKTYGILKKFIGNDKDSGELKFFKKFISEVFKGEDFLSVTIDIDFAEIDIEQEKSNIYKIFTGESSPKPVDSSENDELKYSFIDFYDLIIYLRNRYFHLLQSSWNENISCVNTEYPEFIFKVMIEQGLNWISTIVFEILKFDLSRLHMGK